MAGILNFTRSGATGKIENEGTLTAALGGYIALLAPEVRNSGVIIAQGGTVALAAGEAFELQFDGSRLANVRVEPATIAALVENGNAVPISVQIDSPMTEADHVREIVVFNALNPQRDVARFTLTPASGVARVQTRIRLAGSQQLVALARLSDGSQWSHHVDVVVSLAACVEP